MNKQFLAATLLAAASAATSAADMIGDTLTFTRAYPSVNSEWAGWNPSHVSTTVTAERLRVFRSCPLIAPKDARSSLQMLAIARAMAALCA